MDTIKATRISDGTYRLTYKGTSVEAVRQPDNYFQIILDGKQHKDYLKALKEILRTHVEGSPGPAAALPREEEPPEPCGTVVEVREVEGLDGVWRRLSYSSEGSVVHREILTCPPANPVE